MEKEELFENKKEIEEYKLSYYKWGSYFFKAAVITCAAFIFCFVVAIVR